MSERPSKRRQGHEYVLERLSPYIDEQLQAKERARVEAHLNACPSCRKELQTLQWTKSLLRQGPRVPLPRSFVIREADLTPQRTASERPARRLPARRLSTIALQWATTLVAVLLIVVIAGDVLLGTRPAAPAGQREVAMQSTATSTIVATMVVESEKAVESPAPKAAQEGIEAGTPAEAPRRMIVPTEPAAQAVEASETPEQAQILAQNNPITGTTTSPPMMAQVAPEPGTPQETTPETGPEGNVLPPGNATPEQTAEKAFGAQEPAATPTPKEEKAEQPAETPLTGAAPPPTLAGEPTGEPPREPGTAEATERGTMPGWSTQVARAGWRVAEVGLGLLLVGLIVAVVWMRRRT
jgi:anti-sigma factor RsiW